MFELLKPFAGPVVLLAIEVGISIASRKAHPVLGGLLMGFGICWFFLALVSNKKLIKRFPNIQTWLPFAGPPEQIVTPGTELTSRFISGHTFRIVDVAQNSIIFRRTFEDCDIHGPAVLVIHGIGQIIGCTFQQNSLIPTSQGTINGVITIQDCNFRDCRFHEIGIIAHDGSIDGVKRGFSEVNINDAKDVSPP